MTSILRDRCRASLTHGDKNYTYFSLPMLGSLGLQGIDKLPHSLRILLENLVRNASSPHDDEVVKQVAAAGVSVPSDLEINFRPGRVVLQDFTGVPAVVDLAAMRKAFAEKGGDPTRINPSQQVDLVIDHSVQVDSYASPEAFLSNIAHEFKRNRERYEFLKWGQQAFQNMRVVPPGTGIVHQVNLEYLAPGVLCKAATDAGASASGDLAKEVFFDSLVGTDSHTTMINGLGVLGWGVGGIEAEAAMLGQPVSMLLPEVVGFRLSGKVAEGATATDVVLTVTEMLRKHGVVGKFVEFYGSGIRALSLPDRATIANMAPEYGATMGFFPVDEETLTYLRFTGRSEEAVALMEQYFRAQNMFRDENAVDPQFATTLELDLSTVQASIAGPKRPQDRIALRDAKKAWQLHAAEQRIPTPADASDSDKLTHGSVVIAAITSCTNTSNPVVMMAAGLVARKARAKGLRVKPWVKTSLAPGSQVVTSYLDEANLTADLNALGFHLVGYGCTTCIGNSGPLDASIAKAIQDEKLLVCSVLSGNRNFEGRINPLTRANYLASPPLVVAYAIAGTMDIDFEQDPIGFDGDGKPVFLKDLWPSLDEVTACVRDAVKVEHFATRYAEVLRGPEAWRAIKAPGGDTFSWEETSTYIRRPTFFDALEKQGTAETRRIKEARALLLLGDSVTTDHISPAGAISKDSPAARYLQEHGIPSTEFNSYGSRRGNHEVMVRGTFANIRLRNLLVPGSEGGVSVHFPSGETGSVFDVAMRYAQDKCDLIVIAGKEYGTGSSRDWAAKGTLLLGVKAVIAESYERIHRSNLVGMGVLPLQFLPGENTASLGLSGKEVFGIEGVEGTLTPGQRLTVTADQGEFTVQCRLDSPQEVAYMEAGGILQFVLKSMLGQGSRQKS